mmetsp:Transcript_1406/g.1355  ORF Transcript_1406/g.1355 Transcript_1406/m.1355 type:complete len:119 (-) Transcript_1406:46-402(-)
MFKKCLQNIDMMYENPKIKQMAFMRPELVKPAKPGQRGPFRIQYKKEHLRKVKSIYKIVPEKGVSNEEVEQIFNNFMSNQEYYISRLRRDKSLLTILATSLFGVLFHNRADRTISGEF